MKNKFKGYNPEFTGIVEEFYENNQPKLNVGYKDGKMSGNFINWNKDGSIISEFNVIRNIGPHGRVCYTPYGYWEEGYYKNDKKEGQWKYWVTSSNQLAHISFEESKSSTIQNNVNDLIEGEDIVYGD